MKRLFAVALILLIATAAPAGDAHVDGNRHMGREVIVDLPKDLHVRNTGGTDGAGLCVWASITMNARWLDDPKLAEFFDRMKKETGGGWPERVAQKMKEWAPDVPYVQYEGRDRKKIAAILDLAMKTGRGACVTYGRGERYNNETIAHMVFLAHLDPANGPQPYGAIIDNNFPGTWEWMSREEMIDRICHPNGSGWVIVFLDSPPPPIPSN